MIRATLALLAAALGTATAPAAAQLAGRFQVVPSAGAIAFDRASALKTAPTLGLDASYFLGSGLAVGIHLYTSRVETDGTYFPLVMLDFGDTTYLYTVAQRATLLGAGAQLQTRFPLERLEAVLTAGGGVYRFYMDPRKTQTQTSERLTGPSGVLGAALSYAVSERVGVRIDARDLILLKYDRDAFDPTLAYTRNNRIPDLLPPPPPEKDVVHNLRVAVGFSFVPGPER